MQNYLSISEGIPTTRGDGGSRELQSHKGLDWHGLNEANHTGKQDIPERGRDPEKSVLKEMLKPCGTQQGSPSLRERAGMF